MKNIELKIIGGFFLVLIIIIVIAFWQDNSGYITREQVVIQLTTDSLKEQFGKQLTAFEDSLQNIALQRDSLYEKALDQEQAKVYKKEKQLAEQSKSIAVLEQQYAEQCSELISSYRERHDTAISIIKSKTVALEVCKARVTEWQGIAASKERELGIANSTIKEKNKTITTLKDRNTAIENRQERNWLFRNWYWLGGRWRDYVLQE